MHARRRSRAIARPVLVTLLVLAGCGSGVSSGPGAPSAAGGDAPVLLIVARNIEFTPKRVQLPAGAPVHVSFRNADSGIPHSVSLSPMRSGVVAPVLHETEIVTGPAELEWDLEPLVPGPYLFSCAVHPSMQLEAEAV